ncbi:MAG: trimeric autotransporter adhesin, partial [Thermoleophilaceae bacterium]|nr:trimeric autotransporter adhesin [Thermoleophilaceae bacterium]
TAVNNAAKVLTGVGVFNADGSWVPQPTATVRAVLATPTDIYLGGDFTTVNGTTSTATNHIAKVDRTLGAPDAAWAPDANGSVLALVSDGATLYAGGPFTTFGGQTRRGTAATPLASAGGGAADTWYPGDLNQGGNVQTLALSGSTVYIGGSFTKFAGGPRAGLAAAPTTGTGAMSSWDPATTDTVRAVAAGANGAYAGGTFSGVNAVERTSLMALDLTTGAAMPYFSHTFDNPVHTITVCGDTVYAGGVFFNVDGQPRLDAAAFDRNTGALLPWDPSPDGDVWSIACANGAVYLGGQFITLDYRGVGTGTTRNGLAAVDPVTGALLPWDPAGTSAPSFVYSLAASGNTIYAAGQFAALNSGAAARNNLAAIDGTSGAVLPWNPNVTGRLRSIALAGSTMYAAGSLTAVGGNARGGIAEIDLGSGAPTAFDPGTNNDVSSLAVAPDGTLYVAGIFTTVGGANHQGAAAIAPNGTVSSWDPGLDGTADAAAVGADGRVYVGGSFTGAARRGTLGVATFSEPVGFASAPALSSTTPTAGESVSCSAGSASGSLPAPATYQWQLDGNAIGGATGSSYTPAATDVDHSLACEVMRHNLISSAQATSPSARVVAAPLPPASSSVTPDQAPAPTPGPTPFDIDGQATPPPPVVGKSVIATPSKGTVTVLLPGFKQYIPLPDAERIPVGTIIDATKGAVRLTTVGAGGKLQSAVFSEGVFQVLQETGKSPVVLVKLFGGSFKACPVIKRSAKRALDAATKVSKTKSIRHLWGEGSGLFRTQGRYASATIRGTKWVTDDRCDGTLIRVTKGSVTVRDIPRRKTFALKAPKRYLAQAK